MRVGYFKVSRELINNMISDDPSLKKMKCLFDDVVVISANMTDDQCIEYYGVSDRFEDIDHKDPNVEIPSYECHIEKVQSKTRTKKGFSEKLVVKWNKMNADQVC